MTSVNVTAVVISRYRCCHMSRAAWQFITRSHSTLACGCWSVLMSELSWLVLTRFLVIYSQGPGSAIYYPVQDIKFRRPKQRMTTNQLRIICLFLQYPSSPNFLSCWPEKESSVVLRTTDWKYFQSTDIFNRTCLRQGSKSNLSKTFQIHLRVRWILNSQNSNYVYTCIWGAEGSLRSCVLLVVCWGNSGLLCNSNLARYNIKATCMDHKRNKCAVQHRRKVQKLKYSRIIQHQPSVGSQVTTYFNAAYFHENSIFWCKLIASLAHWTRYSTEHSNHETEGREIGSRSEWTDRYYKVINCDGIGCLSAHALVWVCGPSTGLGGKLTHNLGQMSPGDQVTPGDRGGGGEMGKLTVSTELYPSWWRRWPQPIQTGVLMCRYGTVYWREGRGYFGEIIGVTLSLEISSPEGIESGEPVCVIDSRQ